MLKITLPSHYSSYYFQSRGMTLFKDNTYTKPLLAVDIYLAIASDKYANIQGIMEVCAVLGYWKSSVVHLPKPVLIKVGEALIALLSV